MSLNITKIVQNVTGQTIGKGSIIFKNNGVNEATIDFGSEGVLTIRAGQIIYFNALTTSKSVGIEFSKISESNELEIIRLDSVSSSDWLSIAGNKITYEYYTGIEAGNPTGDKNIKFAKYYSNLTTLVFTQTHTWDSDNDILEITTS